MVRAAESEGEPTDHQSAATPYTPHESPATQHGADLGERPLQPQPHSAPGDVCRQRLFSSPERGTRQHAARLHEAQQPAAQQPEVPAPSATPLLDRRAVAQAHEHPHSEARTRDPYSCSAGGVLKPEVRELFKHLLQTGFIKQLPSRQPKLQLPDMSPVDSAGQACYFTAHHVSEKLSVWETSKQVKVPRCAWAVRDRGVQSSVEILLQQLLWLVLGNNTKSRGDNAAANAFTSFLREEQPNVSFHDVRPCPNVLNTLTAWGCSAMPLASSSTSSSLPNKVTLAVGIGLNLMLTLGDALDALETSGQKNTLYCALNLAASDLGRDSLMSLLMTPFHSFQDDTQLPSLPAHQPPQKRAPPAGSQNGRKRQALDRAAPTVIMPTPTLQPQPTQTSNSATQPRVCFFLPPLFL